MDYKELIDELRSLSLHVPEQMFGEDGKDPLERAADAIETLLAERDYAVEELRGRCSQCKHFSSGPLVSICADCRFECGTIDHWKWRGPHKEKINE